MSIACYNCNVVVKIQPTVCPIHPHKIYVTVIIVDSQLPCSCVYNGAHPPPMLPTYTYNYMTCNAGPGIIVQGR